MGTVGRERRRSIPSCRKHPARILTGLRTRKSDTGRIVRSLSGCHLDRPGVGPWRGDAGRVVTSRGLAPGAIIGMIGMLRIALWQVMRLTDYGPFWPLVALTIGVSLVGVVLWGTVLPFVLKRCGHRPSNFLGIVCRNAS